MTGMNGKTIALVGGPETGKTNFLARLWISLKKGNGALSASNIPEEISYVEEAVEHLHAAEFAPRTIQEGISGGLEISIASTKQASSIKSMLKVPDVMGEEWEKAVRSRELKPEILSVLEEAYGALFFLRVLSPLNESPLDWVTAKNLLALPLEDNETKGKLPTQVCLCELISFLEITASEEQTPKKVAILLTGWDLLDTERANRGPLKFLNEEFPMFAGKLEDTSILDIKVYGVSIVGGDLTNDENFKDIFLDQIIDDSGYVVEDKNETVNTIKDITEPLRWILAS